MSDGLSFTRQLSDQRRSDTERAEVLANPGFGKFFTDHMVVIDYDGTTWHDARLVPYGPVVLDPATMVFHYGQAVFEGLKAYRQENGDIMSFRPIANAERFQRSANRMSMPELPVEDFLESVRQLVDVDKKWIPQAGGEESLYLRPFMIATEVGLGVHPSSSFSYYLLASPAGAYFSGGIKPVSVWVSHEYVRASPGGTGAAKFAGNYAASLIAQEQSIGEGCDQVVWLDAIERKYVEEMGGMNMFFIYGSGKDARVVTPALSGSLLPGITRDSILQVATDLGYQTSEEFISLDEWAAGVADGKITEVLACGTAAVITPVGSVKSSRGSFTIGDGEAGSITMQLRNALTGIQRGTLPDTHHWLMKVG